MKIIQLTAILLCLLSLGCASQQRDFSKFTGYLNSADAAVPNGAMFADNWVPLLESPEADIPFLKRKLTSPNPHEQIAAYTALETLAYVFLLQPTTNGLHYLDLIDPKSVYDHFISYDTSSLSITWQKLFTQTHQNMKKDLEQFSVRYRR